MIKRESRMAVPSLNSNISNLDFQWVKNKAGWAMLFLAFLLFSFFMRKPGDVTVVFIGDSITYGAGLPSPVTDAPPVQAAKYLEQQKYIGKVKFLNEGVSGFTTVNFLPASGSAYDKVIKATDNLYKNEESQLVFSIMLGTNDSAVEGPKGAPVSPGSYFNNLKVITDSLLKRYPGCKVIINYPIWYSANTYNGSKYLQEGLDRLQSYFPEIKRLVKAYTLSNPGRVFTGDAQGFNYFKINWKKYFQQEQGKKGIFFLHPNKEGARALGNFWGKAIAAALQ